MTAVWMMRRHVRAVSAMAVCRMRGGHRPSLQIVLQRGLLRRPAEADPVRKEGGPPARRAHRARRRPAARVRHGGLVLRRVRPAHAAAACRHPGGRLPDLGPPPDPHRRWRRPRPGKRPAGLSPLQHDRWRRGAGVNLPPGRRVDFFLRPPPARPSVTSDSRAPRGAERDMPAGSDPIQTDQHGDSVNGGPPLRAPLKEKTL